MCLRIQSNPTWCARQQSKGPSHLLGMGTAANSSSSSDMVRRQEAETCGTISQ